MVIVLACGVALFCVMMISYVIGGVCADIACEKGYDWDKAFYLCFFLGLIGCLLVAARPNKIHHEKADRLLSDSIHT